MDSEMKLISYKPVDLVLVKAIMLSRIRMMQLQAAIKLELFKDGVLYLDVLKIITPNKNKEVTAMLPV